VAVLDLEQRVASVVNVQLETLNGGLEELVERALQDELDRRVTAILEANIEARAHREEPSNTHMAKATEPRTCNSCGERPAAPGRRVCYGCQEKARRERRRQQTDEAEGHSPSPST
jgi:hypothetical protein